MKDFAAAAISDEKFEQRASRWSLDTPDTKEAYWIRELFEGHFPTESAAKTAVRCVYAHISSYPEFRQLIRSSDGYPSRNGESLPILLDEQSVFTRAPTNPLRTESVIRYRAFKTFG